MKLLYIHHTSINPEKANSIQILQMCKAFAQVGVAITLAVPSNKGVVQVKNDIEKLTGTQPVFEVITFEKTPIQQKLSLVGAYFSVLKMLKQQAKDFDYCFLRNPVLINATLKAGLPTIFEAHQPKVHNESPLMNWFWKRNLLKNVQSDKLVKFIAISGGLGNFWIQEGVPQAKVINLHDAVDIDLFSNDISPEELRHSLNLPLDKKIVTYAGRIEANRGIENVIELAKDTPDLHFVIVGGPNDRKAYYTQRADEIGISNIQFEGLVAHHLVKNYLFAADILLMVWTKQLKHIRFFSPLKMFEYMATGKIIVGHGFTTINEVLTDGENAYLADPESVEDLKKKLKEAATNPDAYLIGEKARQLVEQEYTWKKRAQNIVNSLQGKAETFVH